MPNVQPGLLVRHEDDSRREQSTCGSRYRLISKGDADVAAWAHVVDIQDSRPHYHRRGTELYYVLDGSGTVTLDGEVHEVRQGTLVHIPPGVIHAAQGTMRVLVVGIPDIDETDLYFPATGAGDQET